MTFDFWDFNFVHSWDSVAFQFLFLVSNCEFKLMIFMFHIRTVWEEKKRLRQYYVHPVH